MSHAEMYQHPPLRSLQLAPVNVAESFLSTQRRPVRSSAMAFPERSRAPTAAFTVSCLMLWSCSAFVPTMKRPTAAAALSQRTRSISLSSVAIGGGVGEMSPDFIVPTRVKLESK
jgi:hypothetical protein